MKNLFKKVLYKIARKKFIKDFDKFCTEKKGRALLYYKTEEFYLNGYFSNLSHPNNWESFEIAKIFNEFGFVVDIIDRTATLDDVKEIEDKYDIFLGLGAGDSGQYFADIAERTPKAIRILYAMGPEPDLSNEITKKRHDEFLDRFPGNEIVYRRMIHNVDVKRVMANCEAIITCCNDWGIEGYKKHNKQIERIWLSSYEGLKTDEQEIEQKDQKSFLYFGGNGNIMKGLPLVIEAFSKLSHLKLYIGAPKTEEDFNKIMKPFLGSSKNIDFIGFMDVSGPHFERVSKECGYVILPSSSEGSATSVTTCMRRGLIPIVTVESGVDLGDFGYLLESIDMDYLVDKFDQISKNDRLDFIRRCKDTYKESFKYTKENFRKTFVGALVNIINSNKGNNEKTFKS